MMRNLSIGVAFLLSGIVPLSFSASVMMEQEDKNLRTGAMMTTPLLLTFTNDSDSNDNEQFNDKVSRKNRRVSVSSLASFVSPDIVSRGNHFEISNDQQHSAGGSNAQHFLIKAMNWEGFNTQHLMLQGLDRKDLSSIVVDLKGKGFNTIRMPFSNEMLHHNDDSPTGGCFYKDPRFDKVFTRNPALNYLRMERAGKTCTRPRDAFYNMVRILTEEHGLYVVLDNHNIAIDYWEEVDKKIEDHLWYGQNYTEDQWLNDWRDVVTMFSGNAKVVGYELRNEVQATKIGSDYHFPVWGDNISRAGLLAFSYGRDDVNYYPKNQYKLDSDGKVVWADWRRATLRAIAMIRGLDNERTIFLGGLNWQMDLSFLKSDTQYFKMLRFISLDSASQAAAAYYFWSYYYDDGSDPETAIEEAIKARDPDDQRRIENDPTISDQLTVHLNIAYSVHVYGWVSPRAAQPFPSWGNGWMEKYAHIPIRMFPTAYALRQSADYSDGYNCINECLSRIGTWAVEEFKGSVNLIRQDRVYDHIFGYLNYEPPRGKDPTNHYTAPVWVSEFGIDNLEVLEYREREHTWKLENIKSGGIYYAGSTLEYLHHFVYLTEYMAGRNTSWAYYTLASYYPKSPFVTADDVADVDIFCQTQSEFQWYGWSKTCQPFGLYDPDWENFMAEQYLTDENRVTSRVDPRIKPLDRLLDQGPQV